MTDMANAIIRGLLETYRRRSPYLCRSCRLSLNSRLTIPFLPEPRNALRGSEGNGMTLTVAPSTTHSSWVSGPILSFFRTWEGTETWPRFVTLVRMVVSYKIKAWETSSPYDHHVPLSPSLSRNQQHLTCGLPPLDVGVG